MHQGSPARVVVASLLLAVLAAAVVWTVWSTRDTGGAVESAPDSAAVESEPPSPPVEPIEQPVGPATGDYAELATAAELEHPDTDPHIRRWYDWFGYFVGDEEIAEGEWANKQELWDILAPPIRAEASMLGPPFNQPLYDGDTAQPATADVRWSTGDTGARGEAVEFSATYMTQEGRVTARYWAALIEVAADGTGHVRATMEPFDLLITNYDSFAAFRRTSGDRIWSWIQEQGERP